MEHILEGLKHPFARSKPGESQNEVLSPEGIIELDVALALTGMLKMAGALSTPQLSEVQRIIRDRIFKNLDRLSSVRYDEASNTTNMSADMTSYNRLVEYLKSLDGPDAAFGNLTFTLVPDNKLTLVADEHLATFQALPDQEKKLIIWDVLSSELIRKAFLPYFRVNDLYVVRQELQSALEKSPDDHSRAFETVVEAFKGSR